MYPSHLRELIHHLVSNSSTGLVGVSTRVPYIVIKTQAKIGNSRLTACTVNYSITHYFYQSEKICMAIAEKCHVLREASSSKLAVQ